MKQSQPEVTHNSGRDHCLARQRPDVSIATIECAPGYAGSSSQRVTDTMRGHDRPSPTVTRCQWCGVVVEQALCLNRR